MGSFMNFIPGSSLPSSKATSESPPKIKSVLFLKTLPGNSTLSHGNLVWHLTFSLREFSVSNLSFPWCSLMSISFLFFLGVGNHLPHFFFFSEKSPSFFVIPSSKHFWTISMYQELLRPGLKRHDLCPQGTPSWASRQGRVWKATHAMWRVYLLCGRLSWALWKRAFLFGRQVPEKASQKWRWRGISKGERSLAPRPLEKCPRLKDGKDWGMEGREREGGELGMIGHKETRASWKTVRLSGHPHPLPTLSSRLLFSPNDHQYQLTWITVLLDMRHYYKCINSLNPQNSWEIL